MMGSLQSLGRLILGIQQEGMIWEMMQPTILKQKMTLESLGIQIWILSFFCEEEVDEGEVGALLGRA